MSLAVPLAVRLRTAARDVHVNVADLNFDNVDPGGYGGCSVALHRPISFQPAEIAQYATLTVEDKRNGQTAWEGRLEDAGRGAGAGGEVYDLAAVGGAAHAQDENAPYVSIDQVMEQYERFGTSRGATLDVADDPGGSDENALVLQFPDGIHLVTDIFVSGRYKAIQAAGQKLAAFNYIWSAGATAAGISIQGVTRQDAGVGTLARSQTLNTAGGAQSIRTVVSDFSNGHNLLDIRLIYTGAGTTIANDLHWASVMDLYVAALRLTKAGVEITSGYSGTVLASQIVADLLGRRLTGFDGANARVDTTAYAIDQFAFPDGATAAVMLEELMGFEQGYTWQVWERNAAGKYRFEWKARPSTIRYDATITDGFDSPSSSDGLYNAVSVRWKDSKGRTRTTFRTLAVPALTAAGLTRKERLDLGDEVGSSAGAVRAGDQFLAEHQYPTNEGNLTVARPILDRVLSRMVMPWEIRSGELIRVRGVRPNPNTLNATSRDGETVFKIARSAFSQSTASASLSLDSYTRSQASAIAKLTAKSRR